MFYHFKLQLKKTRLKVPKLRKNDLVFFNYFDLETSGLFFREVPQQLPVLTAGAF
jgi:hypothetical protein